MRLVAFLFVGLLSGCGASSGATNVPGGGQCPLTAPTIGDACAVAPGEFCSFPKPDGAEHVCHCEAARWSCFDKPAGEPPA